MLNKQQIVLLYFFITFLLLSTLLLFSNNFLETEPFQSIIDCEALGYPHDFCLRIPLEALPTSKSTSVELNVGDLL